MEGFSCPGGWGNGRSFFLDTTVTPSPDLELYTDASGSFGFGGYFRGQCFQGRWPPRMQLNRERGISIEWQELFPIYGFHTFLGNAFNFGCDNDFVVAS